MCMRSLAGLNNMKAARDATAAGATLSSSSVLLLTQQHSVLKQHHHGFAVPRDVYDARPTITSRRGTYIVVARY